MLDLALWGGSRAIVCSIFLAVRKPDTGFSCVGDNDGSWTEHRKAIISSDDSQICAKVIEGLVEITKCIGDILRVF